MCPTYTSLSTVNELLQDSVIQLGAQDVYWEDEGAFTGQISVPMLKDSGCEFVIIGHSERRQYFNETDQTVNRKIKKVLASGGLVPIVCVGEKLEERESGNAFKVVETQVKDSLSGLKPEEINKLVIAYEPVWAIGTGKTATPQQAEEVHAFIRKIITGLAEDPRPAISKKLTNTEDWRIRVGSNHILYRIKDSRLLVWVVRIAYRSDAYRRS